MAAVCRQHKAGNRGEVVVALRRTQRASTCNCMNTHGQDTGASVHLGGGGAVADRNGTSCIACPLVP